MESTGREFSVPGSDGLSLIDGKAGLMTIEEYTSDFTDAEKTELALYMMEKWAKFGRKLSLTSIEYCPNPVAIKINTKRHIKDNDALKFILEAVEGVEQVMINTHKYDILVIIGELFDRRVMAMTLQQKVEEYIQI